MLQVGFQAYKKANPRQLQFETPSFHMLDHTGGGRVGARGVAKGKTKERKACSMMVLRATNRKKQPPTTTKPATDAGTI